MTYWSFSKWSPFFGILPSARARSAATLGFSAMMSDLDIFCGEGKRVALKKPAGRRRLHQCHELFPGGFFKSRFSSRRRRVEESAALGKSDFSYGVITTRTSS